MSSSTSTDPLTHAASIRALSGDRIEAARARRGLSKAEAARRSGITARTWTRYASEGAPATAAPALTEALGFSGSFFIGGSLPPLAADGVNFRAGRRASAAHRHAAIAAGTFGVLVDQWIDARFTRPSWDSSEAPGADALPPEKPELAARSLRYMWGLGASPLPNLVQLCESRGIRVYGLPPLAESVDAFSGWCDTTPYIFIARRKTPERSRFDVAHELGHLLLHAAASTGSGTPCATGTSQEQEADRFAAEFLMPSTATRANLPHNPSVDQVLTFRRRFAVSAMATARSLLRAGRIDDAGYQRLCSALARRGFRNAEPGGMAHHERSRVFTHVFGPSAGEKRTSAATIAADLSLPVEDVHALTFNTEVRPVPTVDEAAGHPTATLPSRAHRPTMTVLPGGAG